MRELVSRKRLRVTAPTETWEHLIHNSHGSARVKVNISGKDETISLASFRDIVIQSVIEALTTAIVRMILIERKKRKARRDAAQED
jgi:hypothetical protein